MVSKESLQILKQGSHIWNRWREERAVQNPDLAGANLSKWNLSGTNLSETDLKEADLTAADQIGRAHV